jgi:hypothetical protein
MDLLNCTVLHAGNRGMTIEKSDVTPAEIVILRLVHGEDSVVNIEKVKSSRPVDSRKERERLAAYYGEDVVKRAYPGVSPVLPKTLREAGVEAEPEAPEEDESPAAAAAAEAAALPAAVAGRLARAKGAAESLVG